MPAIKKKILWISEYRVNTGFSRVTESILKHLAKDFDVTLLDIYRTIEGKYNVTDQIAPDTTIKILGCMSPHDGWGLNRAKQVCDQYDAIFIIQDIWNINDIIRELKSTNKKLPPIVVYFPIDAVDHDAAWYKNFDLISKAVTYTQFAKQEVDICLEELYTGIYLEEQREKVQVIPHGIDTEHFFKLDSSKSELRKKLLKTDSCANSFIFLNANRNQTRKRLDLTLKAFQLFISEHSDTDARIYMHCGNTDSHIDITKLATRYGISPYLIMTTDNAGIPNCTDEELNLIYNCCDVGINTSMGEGWGLTAIEHAVTGAPQLVPNHSACKELFSELVSTIYAPTSFTMDNYMTVGKLIEPTNLASLMWEVYKDKELCAKNANLCYNKFTSSEYQWREISKLWKNTFDSVMVKA